MFCPTCGSMMFPSNGFYVCKGKVKDKISGDERPCDTKIPIGNATVVKTNAQDKNIAVIGNDATLPKTNILCPKCENTEAYFVIRQTRAADEPETVFYRCCKCNHNWRVN